MNPTINRGDTETRRLLDFSVYFKSPRFSHVWLWVFPLSFLSFFFFFPLSRIFALTFTTSSITLENFQIVYSALRFTFYQAILSPLLTIFLGLPSAYLFARYDFRGKFLLRALTAVPFMLPTVVVAAGFSALLGPRGLIHALFPLFSFNFVGTLTAILMAHVFYNTTIITRVVGNALSSLDPKLEQAARSLGADTFHVWRDVTIPLLLPSLLSASLLVFLFDFTSFGVILLLGGSQFATLEVEIYLRILKLPDLPLAALLSVVQLVCTMIFSLIYTYVVTRTAIQTAPRSAKSNIRKPK